MQEYACDIRSVFDAGRTEVLENEWVRRCGVGKVFTGHLQKAHSTETQASMTRKGGYPEE